MDARRSLRDTGVIIVLLVGLALVFPGDNLVAGIVSGLVLGPIVGGLIMLARYYLGGDASAASDEDPD